MRPLVRQVERLQRLATFEAAARLGSFSAAGRELGMAQPAVTRQIQALECSIGVDLFERHANRIELTGVGQTLLQQVDASFSGIEATLDDLQRGTDSFVLAMPPGFAQQLVLPRLDDLQRTLGDCDLRLWLYDRESDLADAPFDVAVQVGDGRWPGLGSELLLPERVTPVATPTLAADWGLHESSSAADVLAAPLLHMDATDRAWLSWADWLAAFDLALTKGRRRVEFNNYPALLQQMLAGRGVGLAWDRLTDELIRDGVLVPVGPTVSSDNAYHLTWPAARRVGAIDVACRWLHEVVDAPST